MIAGQERSVPIEINANNGLYTVTFTANGEYLLSGGDNVEVWRIQDSQRVATMEARKVRCLAASKIDRWIAGGTFYGEVFVWDAETYKTVWKDGNRISGLKQGRANETVSFSPDSTRLVTVAYYTTTVWEIPHGKQTQTLAHPFAHSAIFSPSS